MILSLSSFLRFIFACIVAAILHQIPRDIEITIFISQFREKKTWKLSEIEKYIITVDNVRRRNEMKSKLSLCVYIYIYTHIYSVTDALQKTGTWAWWRNYWNQREDELMRSKSMRKLRKNSLWGTIFGRVEPFEREADESKTYSKPQSERTICN